MQRFFAVTFLCTACLSARPDDIAFTDVHLLPMDHEEILRDQFLIVRDGRIASFGAQRDFAPDASLTVVDGGGRYLLPGLSEMHAHVPGADRPEYAHEVLILYAVNGVTLIRGMLGQPWHLELREQIAQQTVLGPRLYTSGPSLNGNSVDGAVDAERQVRAQATAGYDFLKLHPGLSREEFEAIARTAGELDMPFAGHVSSDVGLERTLAAGQASIDHLDGYVPALVDAQARPAAAGLFGFGLIAEADAGRIPLLARRTAAAGVWNVPTATLLEQLVSPQDPALLAAREAMRYVAPEMLAGWVREKRARLADPGYDATAARRFIELRRQLILALHEAGAGLLLGSDAPQTFQVPGFSVHEELAVLIGAGLTPYQALRSGTLQPARFFGAEGRFGRIAAGLDADLLLVDGNPLEALDTLRRPHGVMLRGRWLDRAELDRRLAEIAGRYATQ